MEETEVGKVGKEEGRQSPLIGARIQDIKESRPMIPIYEKELPRTKLWSNPDTFVL